MKTPFVICATDSNNIIELYEILHIKDNSIGKVWFEPNDFYHHEDACPNGMFFAYISNEVAPILSLQLLENCKWFVIDNDDISNMILQISPKPIVVSEDQFEESVKALDEDKAIEAISSSTKYIEECNKEA